MDLGLGTVSVATMRKLHALTLDDIFAPQRIHDRQAAAACWAGLHLLINDVEGAHKIAQDLFTPEGSYWHGVVHRRDGDYWNAKYWFRRVGKHPVYEAIGDAVTDRLETNCLRGGLWDPAAFVDAVERRDSIESAQLQQLVKLQESEWTILFDYCWHEAVVAPS